MENYYLCTVVKSSNKIVLSKNPVEKDDRRQRKHKKCVDRLFHQCWKIELICFR